MSDKIVEIKRGRGRPKTATKVDARRVDMKIRWKEVEIELIKNAAEIVSEDVSPFVRDAALSRARAILNK